MARLIGALTAAVVLAAALGLGAAVGAASAPDVANDAGAVQSDEPILEQDHVVRLEPADPETVYVDTTLEFANRASFDAYSVDTGDDAYVVTDAENLSRNGSTWQLDDGATSASFTAAIDVENATNAAATAETGLLTVQLRDRDRLVDANGSAVAPDRERSVAVDGDGVVRGDTALLGPVERRTGTWGTTTVELLVGENATLEASPDEVAESFRTADLSLPGRRTNVSVVAVSDALAVPSPGDETLVVEADASIDGVDNAWLQEYVRVTQRLEVAADFAWFPESYARYQGARLALEQGHANWSEFQSFLAVDRGNATAVNLSDADSWHVEDSDVHAQGAHALAAMDVDYRDHGGAYDGLQYAVDTLDDDQPVDVDDFLSPLTIGGLHSAPPARQLLLEPELGYRWRASTHESAFGYDPLVPPPNAGIDVSEDGTLDGATILNATAAESEPGDADVASYRWRWGDGSTATTERSSRQHLPQNAGRQEILVTIVDEYGRTDTAATVLDVDEEDAVGGGALEWHTTDPSGDPATPSVVNGTVYFGTNGGSLHAYDATTGEEQWSTPTPSGDIYSAPAVANGTVVAGTTNGTLFAADADTGELEWSFTEPTDVHTSSPSVTDGTVYVGGDAGRLYAVDVDTGEQEWAFGDPLDRVVMAPVVAAGTVYLEDVDGTLYALDAESGVEQWTSDLAGGSSLSSYTVANGTLFLGGENEMLYALDADTGDVEWTFTEPTWDVTTPTVADGTVYVGSRDEHLYAVDAATGERVWAHEATQSVNSPTVAGGTVYASSIDGRLRAVDAATGLRKWTFDLGGYTSGSPIVADGTLYYGSDGSFHAIDVDHEASSNGSRARLGTLGHVGDRADAESGDQRATVGGTEVRDLDGDGNYRDVNGDGSVTNSDVTSFFHNQHTPAWDERVELFDFDGNGDVGQSDVVALFEYVV